jgi:hypothetical protein
MFVDWCQWYVCCCNRLIVLLQALFANRLTNIMHITLYLQNNTKQDPVNQPSSA